MMRETAQYLWSRLTAHFLDLQIDVRFGIYWDISTGQMDDGFIHYLSGDVAIEAAKGDRVYQVIKEIIIHACTDDYVADDELEDLAVSIMDANKESLYSEMLQEVKAMVK